MHRLTFSYCAAAALALSALGCGPSVDDYPLLRPDAEVPDPSILEEEAKGPSNVIEDDPLEPWDETDTGPLTGIFAVEVTVPAKVFVELETRQLFRFRILQRGRQLRTKSQMCRIALPSVDGVAELDIPLELEMLIRAKAVEEEGEHLSSEQAVGAQWTPPMVTVVLGADLADPEVDPLPTADNLFNALDEDDDGQPGVTLLASTLLCAEKEAAYAALRAGALIDGTVEDADTISGTVEPVLEQSVLGFSDPCMAAAADLPVEVLPGSSFRAVRTNDEHDVNDNGNVTCGEIVVAAPELFGDYWLGR
jgi:hypothetical protein